MKLVTTTPKLANRNPKELHPISICISGISNNIITQLHQYVKVEFYFRVKELNVGSPSDLNVLFVDIISNWLIEILIGR